MKESKMINGVGGTYFDISQYQLSEASAVATETGKEDSGEAISGIEESGEAGLKNSQDQQKDQLNPQELTEEELTAVDKLQERDLEVKQHEAEHMSVGGGLVRGGMRLEYSTGPDGVQYAVGGEVSIDMSTGSTPEETASKMSQVKAAALAPSEPSGQDLAVAAQATQIEMDALREATEKKTEDLEVENKKDDDKKSKEKKENQTIEDDITDKKSKNIDASSTTYSLDIFA
jgi:hypothetical protein